MTLSRVFKLTDLARLRDNMTKSSEGLKLVIFRNAFYRDNYRRAIIVLLLIAALLL